MENKPKKRKIDVITQLTGTREQIKIVVPDYLRCVICNNRVYNYRNISNKDEIVCSYDCFSVLQLSKVNRFLHEQSTEENKMVKSYSFEDLMVLEN